VFNARNSLGYATDITHLRLLGVVISSRLTMGGHLDQLLSSCASSIFALRTLKSHDLRPPLLHQVTRATTVASLLYASPAWWGLATAEEKSRMERLFGRLRRGGYLLADFPTGCDLGCSCQPPAVRLNCQQPVPCPEAPLPRERGLISAFPVKDDNNFVSWSLYAELKT